MSFSYNQNKIYKKTNKTILNIFDHVKNVNAHILFIRIKCPELGINFHKQNIFLIPNHKNLIQQQRYNLIEI